MGRKQEIHDDTLMIYVYYITVIYRNVVHWCSLEILQKVPLEFTLYTVHPIFGQWQRHHQAAEWPKAVMMIQALASKRGGTNPLGWSTHGWQLVWVGGGPMDLCLWYRIFRHEHPFTRYYVDFEPIATWLHPEGDIHFFSPNCLYCSCTEVLKNICQL